MHRKMVSWVGAILFLACGGAWADSGAMIRPGDSVAIVGNTFADQMRKHGYFETLLRQRVQGEGVSFRNLGWPGDTLTAKATVKAVREEGGEHLVDITIITTNEAGEKVLSGNATARIDP